MKLLGLVMLTGAGSAFSAPAQAGGFFDFLIDLFGGRNPGSNLNGPVSVPEPAALALFATGAIAVGLMRRRKKN
jgi:hypothetical protein